MRIWGKATLDIVTFLVCSIPAHSALFRFLQTTTTISETVNKPISVHRLAELISSRVLYKQILNRQLFLFLQLVENLNIVPEDVDLYCSIKLKSS